MKRRNFIKLSLILATSLYADIKIKKKTLVIIELDGANDSLNTIVPYSSKVYYKLRPSIALKKEDLNILNHEFGLSKELDFLYDLYKSKNLAVINGLGYDNPNFSHFKSIQIVETNVHNQGWLQNTLNKYNLDDTRPAHALIIGKQQKTFMFSKQLNILQIKNIKKFIKQSDSFSYKSIANEYDFIEKENNIVVQANRAFKKYIKDDAKTFDSGIEEDLHEALKVIDSNIQIPVIKISQGGYDTHANQLVRQKELHKDLNNALKYFVSELKKRALFDDVLIMTYSEFGRRVKENGSQGTDHGAAASHFVIGGSVKGGILTKHPDLNKLDKNNLVYTTHFGSLYNSILTQWFKNEDNSFKQYPMLSLV